jgi:DNA-binding transcriptional LysR family regulator
MRVAVVGAPSYLARGCPPRTPDDLARHSCIQYRRAADGVMFQWTFERNGKSRQISVDGRVIVNDADLAVRAAVDGLGIAYAAEAVADPFLHSGQLVRVLEDWSPCFEGFFIIPAIGRCGRTARPDRHAPQCPRFGAGQKFARALLGGRLNLAGRRRSHTSPGCERLPMRGHS